MSLDQKRTYAKLHMAKVYQARREHRLCADCCGPAIRVRALPALPD